MINYKQMRSVVRGKINFFIPYLTQADYYLLHAMMEGGYKKYDKFHLWDFVGEQKAKGLVKHMGFSFHAGPQLLDRLLKEHPEVDFVQLQINYADWENPSVTARANYEVARKHGKSIVVMELVKGGNLANPPAAVKRLFRITGKRPVWRGKHRSA